MQALLYSQIIETDKVEVLSKHLSGRAKTLIGSHYSNIDEDLDSLLSYFGNEARIRTKCQEKFQGSMLESIRKSGDIKVMNIEAQERREVQH